MAGHPNTQPSAGTADDTEKKESPTPNNIPRPAALVKKASRQVHRADTKTNKDNRDPDREGVPERIMGFVKQFIARLKRKKIQRTSEQGV